MASLTSRRSSDTSLDERRSKASTCLSLEYDDYPLDLMSASARDTERRLLEMIPDWHTNGDGTQPKTAELRQLLNEIRNATRGEEFGNQIGTTAAFEHGESNRQSVIEVTERSPSDEALSMRERFLSEEVITDMGRRSYCDYDMTDGGAKHANNAVFVPDARSPILELDDKQSSSNESKSDGHKRCMRNLIDKMCGCCMVRHHPLPVLPSRRERCLHAIRCPPHGKVAVALTFALSAFTIWACTWVLTGSQALLGGQLFALITLWVTSHLFGRLVSVIRLPPVLGMLAAGCLLRNCPGIDVAKHIDPDWAEKLRSISLAVVLLNGGLRLQAKALTRWSFSIARLALLPCALETAAVALASRWLLSYPWLWAAILGFSISAVAPAVVVPAMIRLQTSGYGRDKAIPSFLMAAAFGDNIFTLFSLSVLCALAFTRDNFINTALRGPLDVMGAVLYGVVCGGILSYLPNPKNAHVTSLRFALLLCCGVCSILGAPFAGCHSTGSLACVTTAFVAAYGWRETAWAIDSKSRLLGLFTNSWRLCEPLLFSLIGIQLEIPGTCPGSLFGFGTGVLVIGLIARLLACMLAVTRTSLSPTERLYVPIAWLPKATVQIIGTAMVTGLANKYGTDSDMSLATQNAALAILVVLLTAPLGAALSAIMGPRTLRQSTSHTDHSTFNYVNDASCERKEVVAHFKRGRIEVTTERETVA